MNPLSLTVIITTSPVRSNPSLSMINATVSTFHLGGEKFNLCPRLIVCDGYRVKDDDDDDKSNKSNKSNNSSQSRVTKKHSCDRSAMRSGIVSADQAENYGLYKRRIREAIERDAGVVGAPFFNTTILELQERQGYGFALRAAVAAVDTKYVCVIQHDRCFMRESPMEEAVRAMDADEKVKYVGMLMRSNLNYKATITGRYGAEMEREIEGELRRPEELLLDGSKYCNEEVAHELFSNFGKCGEKYASLRKAYLSAPAYQDLLSAPKRSDGKVQASLIPTLFWYDNVHIARTEHYRDFVFDPKLKLVAKGGFVEDKLSPAMVKTARKLGFKEGWGKFGCFLLDDHCGVSFTGHLDGGSYLTDEQRRGVVTSRANGRPNDRTTEANERNSAKRVNDRSGV